MPGKRRGLAKAQGFKLNEVLKIVLKFIVWLSTSLLQMFRVIGRKTFSVSHWIRFQEDFFLHILLSFFPQTPPRSLCDLLRTQTPGLLRAGPFRALARDTGRRQVPPQPPGDHCGRGKMDVEMYTYSSMRWKKLCGRHNFSNLKEARKRKFVTCFMKKYLRNIQRSDEDKNQAQRF